MQKRSMNNSQSLQQKHSSTPEPNAFNSNTLPSHQRQLSDNSNALIISNKQKVVSLNAAHSSHPLKKNAAKNINLNQNSMLLENNNSNSFTMARPFETQSLNETTTAGSVSNSEQFQQQILNSNKRSNFNQKYRLTPEPKSFNLKSNILSSNMSGNSNNLSIFGPQLSYNNQQAAAFYSHQIKGSGNMKNQYTQRQQRVKSQLQKNQNLLEKHASLTGSGYYSNTQGGQQNGQNGGNSLILPQTAKGNNRNSFDQSIDVNQNKAKQTEQYQPNQAYQNYINGAAVTQNRPISANGHAKKNSLINQSNNFNNVSPPPIINPQGLQGIQKMNNASQEQPQQILAKFSIDNSLKQEHLPQQLQPKSLLKSSIAQQKQKHQSQTERQQYNQIVINNQQQAVSLKNQQFQDQSQLIVQNSPTKTINKISNIVTKFSFATKTGMQPQNPKKQNQDAYITHPHFLGLRHCHFFSVCDGHGLYGREVSSLLKHRLPFLVENYLKEKLKDHDLNTYPDKQNVFQAIKEGFAEANREVCSILSDVRFTNVGDSRAVIARVFNEKLGCDALSRDHKPDDSQEAEVIINAGGRIDSYRDNHGNGLGPLRVWLLDQNIPGLAMTRSFGDMMAAKVGVNAIPEFTELELTPCDKFIVLASDGVWEFLQNIDVARIIYPFYQKKNAEGAAECLVREAFKKWKKEEDSIDDITCIVIFLDVK